MLFVFANPSKRIVPQEAVYFQTVKGTGGDYHEERRTTVIGTPTGGNTFLVPL